MDKLNSKGGPPISLERLREATDLKWLGRKGAEVVAPLGETVFCTSLGAGFEGKRLQFDVEVARTPISCQMAVADTSRIVTRTQRTSQAGRNSATTCIQRDDIDQLNVAVQTDSVDETDAGYGDALSLKTGWNDCDAKIRPRYCHKSHCWIDFCSFQFGSGQNGELIGAANALLEFQLTYREETTVTDQHMHRQYEQEFLSGLCFLCESNRNISAADFFALQTESAPIRVDFCDNLSFREWSSRDPPMAAESPEEERKGVKVRCPNCDRRGCVPAAAKKVKCPKCGSVVVMPSAKGPESPSQLEGDTPTLEQATPKRIHKSLLLLVGGLVGGLTVGFIGWNTYAEHQETTIANDTLANAVSAAEKSLGSENESVLTDARKSLEHAVSDLHVSVGTDSADRLLRTLDDRINSLVEEKARSEKLRVEAIAREQDARARMQREKELDDIRRRIDRSIAELDFSGAEALLRRNVQHLPSAEQMLQQLTLVRSSDTTNSVLEKLDDLQLLQLQSGKDFADGAISFGPLRQAQTQLLLAALPGELRRRAMWGPAEAKERTNEHLGLWVGLMRQGELGSYITANLLLESVVDGKVTGFARFFEPTIKEERTGFIGIVKTNYHRSSAWATATLTGTLIGNRLEARIDEQLEGPLKLDVPIEYSCTIDNRRIWNGWIMSPPQRQLRNGFWRSKSFPQGGRIDLDQVIRLPLDGIWCGRLARTRDKHGKAILTTVTPAELRIWQTDAEELNAWLWLDSVSPMQLIGRRQHDRIDFTVIRSDAAEAEKITVYLNGFRFGGLDSAIRMPLPGLLIDDNRDVVRLRGTIGYQTPSMHFVVERQHEMSLGNPCIGVAASNWRLRQESRSRDVVKKSERLQTTACSWCDGKGVIFDFVSVQPGDKQCPFCEGLGRRKEFVAVGKQTSTVSEPSEYATAVVAVANATDKTVRVHLSATFVFARRFDDLYDGGYPEPPLVVPFSDLIPPNSTRDVSVTSPMKVDGKWLGKLTVSHVHGCMVHVEPVE